MHEDVQLRLQDSAGGLAKDDPAVHVYLWEGNDGNLARLDSALDVPEKPGGTVFEIFTVQEVPAKRPDFPVAGDRGYEKVGGMGEVEGRGKRCSWSEDAMWSRNCQAEHKYTAALI